MGMMTFNLISCRYRHGDLSYRINLGSYPRLQKMMGMEWLRGRRTPMELPDPPRDAIHALVADHRDRQRSMGGEISYRAAPLGRTGHGFTVRYRSVSSVSYQLNFDWNSGTLSLNLDTWDELPTTGSGPSHPFDVAVALSDWVDRLAPPLLTGALRLRYGGLDRMVGAATVLDLWSRDELVRPYRGWLVYTPRSNEQELEDATLRELFGLSPEELRDVRTMIALGR